MGLRGFPTYPALGLALNPAPETPNTSLGQPKLECRAKPAEASDRIFAKAPELGEARVGAPKHFTGLRQSGMVIGGMLCFIP